MTEAERARFSYSEMSSLVIESDRSRLVKRDKEGGSGVVESLWGRIDTREMGIRASREAAPVAKKPRTSTSGVLGIKSIRAKSLVQDAEFADLRYRPRSKETRMAYEFILSLVHSMMTGDQSEDVVRGATDEVIAILKAETSSDEQKRQDIKTIVMDAPSGKLEQLLNLGVKLTDYQLVQEEEGIEEGHQGDEGIAVMIQGEEEDDDQGMGVIVEEEDEDQPVILEENVQRLEGEPEILDLSSLEFAQGGHTMTNKRCLLPEGSFKKPGKGYEEIHIPAPQPRPMDPGEVLVAISSLPEWMQPAFPPQDPPPESGSESCCGTCPGVGQQFVGVCPDGCGQDERRPLDDAEGDGEALCGGWHHLGIGPIQVCLHCSHEGIGSGTGCQLSRTTRFLWNHSQ